MDRGKDAIERLKRKLYTRDAQTTVGDDIRTPIVGDDEVSLPAHDWAHEEKKEDIPEGPPIAALLAQEQEVTKQKGMSIAVKFFIASLIFFLGAAGVASYFFFGGGIFVSPKNIDIQIVAPSLVSGGKVSTVQVIVTNRNKAAIKDVSLAIAYPEGTRSATGTAPLLRDHQMVGVVEPGAQSKSSSQAVFYGQQGEKQKLSVTVSYAIEGSAATFQKQEQIEFIVGSSPVALMVSAPEEGISGQTFTIDLDVQASGEETIDNVAVEAQYPSGFTFISSTPAASSRGTLWQVGKVVPGDIKKISITGKLDGQDGDQKVFHFSSGTFDDPSDAHISVPFLTVPSTISIRQSFLSATLALNGQTGNSIPIEPGGMVQGVVSYKNNLTVPVANATFKLSLKGNVLDAGSVNALGGFYQSADNTITWDSQNTPVLAYLAPGKTGTLQFSFKTHDAANTNPTLELSVDAAGVRSGSTDVPERVSGAATARATVSSNVALRAQALHFSGPLQNGGPMPPAPGQKTSYTIEWGLKNSSNSIANAKVTASLPAYVEFVEAGQGSGITYDAPNRTVTWNIGNVSPGVGYAQPERTGVFKVMLTPSDSQIGQSPALTGQTSFTGTDRFTQAALTGQVSGPTTALSGDGSGYQDAMGAVAK